MIKLDNDCVYRNKLDYHKRNICKTNTVVWKENFGDDWEIIKIYEKKTVFPLISMEKKAQRNMLARASQSALDKFYLHALIGVYAKSIEVL